MKTTDILALSTKPAKLWTEQDYYSAKELLQLVPEVAWSNDHLELLLTLGEAADVRTSTLN